MTDMNTDYQLDVKSLRYKVEILTLDTKFFRRKFILLIESRS